MTLHTAFIGGGNMASAILGGLIREGTAPAHVWVLEPDASTRDRLQNQYGVHVLERADEPLQQCGLIVWAVKPQVFKDAAAPCQAFTSHALHLSVAAGIPSDSIARWLGTERVVRAMPNTPALVGKGMTALFGRDAVTAQDRQLVERALQPTGEMLWVSAEKQLDAVTALSGSGPAYVFYFLEAMAQAGVEMGLPQEMAYQLALGTFGGATSLAAQSDEAPATLRERVTSKGGTTYAALSSMEHDQVKTLFIKAMASACRRAEELGREFGQG